MSKKAPYFLFYPTDWLDSERIFDMGLECEGAYIRLLSAMWKRAGFIPDKENWCCNLLRCKPATWRKIRRVLVDDLGVVLVKNSTLFNSRLLEEVELFSQKKEKNKQNAEQRWGKQPLDVAKETIKKPNKINKSNDAVASISQSETYAIPEPEPELELDNKPPNSPPSFLQVEIFEKKLSLDLEGFFVHYNNNDWHVGKGGDREPIVDWRKLARAWSNRRAGHVTTDGRDFKPEDNDMSWADGPGGLDVEAH
ncbi:MAG: hypothetical protein COB22_05955 [Cycloclasticus sp.]|nr:MAG: hypothetical protein COB22_05955 [Cycloclasticus sp.]